MIYIAHRALFEGPNQRWENHPDQIRLALAAGFDCEIDARLIDGKWWLGHDEPTYEVDAEFLYQPGLWIHCKNAEALVGIDAVRPMGFMAQPNYFWHETDAYTLTSHGFIWTYPGKPVDPLRGIRVQPEWNKWWFEDVLDIVGYGVCSKFVKALREMK